MDCKGPRGAFDVVVVSGASVAVMRVTGYAASAGLSVVFSVSKLSILIFSCNDKIASRTV
jgi:hypothetical protein